MAASFRSSPVWRVSFDNAEEPPLAGYTLQLVKASVIELQPRADDKVAQCARYEDFAGSGKRGHAGADVDTDATDVIASDLTLAGVQSGTHFDA